MDVGRIDVALFGATGYTGCEAARLLHAHPALRLAAVFGGRQRDGVPLSVVHPSLRGSVDLTCEGLDLEDGAQGPASGRAACS